MAEPGRCAGLLAFQLAQRALQIVLLAQRLHQRQLGLQEVDMLLGVLEDLRQQFAADIVLGLLALLDPGNQHGAAGGLDRKVGGQAFGHVLADRQLVQVLQVGQAVQEQDALDELVGVLHLADRFVIGDLAQTLEAPVLVHAGMQEILIHRGQLIGEHSVEQLDDRLVALHVEALPRVEFRGNSPKAKTYSTSMFASHSASRARPVQRPYSAALFGGVAQGLAGLGDHVAHVAHALGALGRGAAATEHLGRPRRALVDGGADFALTDAVAVADVQGTDPRWRNSPDDRDIADANAVATHLQDGRGRIVRLPGIQ